MRPSELLGLRKEDVISLESSPSGGCYLVLGHPSYGTKVNRAQTVQLKRPWAIAAARAMVHSTGTDGQKLIPLTYGQAARSPAVACLFLTHLRFTFHSPRSGVATQDSLDGQPFVYIKNRGRWASDVSCKTYLDIYAALSLRTTSVAGRLYHLLQNPAFPFGFFYF